MTLPKLWPSAGTPHVPVGSPVYIVLRMANGGHQMAHESAARQGEVVVTGLTREQALSKALSLNVAARGQVLGAPEG